MKIKSWLTPEDQMCKLGRHHWSIPRLFELVRELPVMEVPIDHLNIYYTYKNLTLREMVMHIEAVHSADLDKPIILDEDGELLDGRHRIMRAILEGRRAIKAVRFDENPPPCKITDD